MRLDGEIYRVEWEDTESKPGDPPNISYLLANGFIEAAKEAYRLYDTLGMALEVGELQEKHISDSGGAWNVIKLEYVGYVEFDPDDLTI
jgi:hypothetical protein